MKKASPWLLRFFGEVTNCLLITHCETSLKRCAADSCKSSRWKRERAGAMKQLVILTLRKDIWKINPLVKQDSQFIAEIPRCRWAARDRAVLYEWCLDWRQSSISGSCRAACAMQVLFQLQQPFKKWKEYSYIQQRLCRRKKAKEGIWSLCTNISSAGVFPLCSCYVCSH